MKKNTKSPTTKCHSVSPDTASTNRLRSSEQALRRIQFARNSKAVTTPSAIASLQIDSTVLDVHLVDAANQAMPAIEVDLTVDTKTGFIVNLHLRLKGHPAMPDSIQRNRYRPQFAAAAERAIRLPLFHPKTN